MKSVSPISLHQSDLHSSQRIDFNLTEKSAAPGGFVSMNDRIRPESSENMSNIINNRISSNEMSSEHKQQSEKYMAYNESLGQLGSRPIS